MSPEDREKFAAAFRAWMDNKSDADTPGYMARDGRLMTPREAMEDELASGAAFLAAELALAQRPGTTVDQLIDRVFRQQPAPQPNAIQPPDAQKHEKTEYAMTPQDKKKLEDAYRAFVARHPKADAPIEGSFDKNGAPMTLRKAFEKTISSGKLEMNVRKYLRAHPGTTVDEYIALLDQLYSVTSAKSAPGKPPRRWRIPAEKNAPKPPQ